VNTTNVGKSLQNAPVCYISAMETKKEFRILGLAKSEIRVLEALEEGFKTPLSISKQAKVSRPAVYEILGRLKERGLVGSYIEQRKHYWRIRSDKQIEEALYEAKRSLLQIPEGREEVHGRVDSAVIVHRGKEAIKKTLLTVFEEHKHERFYGLQGDVSTIQWNKVFSVAETNRFNRNIKKNQIIVHAVLPQGWFERQTKALGEEWAQDFEGRTTRVSVIDPEYFKHAAQLWVFKESVYLISLSEEIMIEVRNSEIQKMILSLFRFVDDNSRTVDANALLRSIIKGAQ